MNVHPSPRPIAALPPPPRSPLTPPGGAVASGHLPPLPPPTTSAAMYSRLGPGDLLQMGVPAAALRPGLFLGSPPKLVGDAMQHPLGIHPHLGLPMSKDGPGLTLGSPPPPPFSLPGLGPPAPGQPPFFTYDTLYPYPGFGAYDARRKNATRESTNTLKAWLYEHKKNPYPTKGEKIMLAIITKMTLTQVSTWFANARRRLKKENKMTWTESPGKEDDEDDDSDDVGEDGEEGVRGEEEDGGSVDLEGIDDDIDVENDDDSVPHPHPSVSTLGAAPPQSPTPPTPAGASTSRFWEAISPCTSPVSTASSSQHRDTRCTDTTQKPCTSSSPVLNSPASNTSPPKASNSSPPKPKIWSLADMASSDSSTTRSTVSKATSKTEEDSPRVADFGRFSPVSTVRSHPYLHGLNQDSVFSRILKERAEKSGLSSRGNAYFPFMSQSPTNVLQSVIQDHCQDS